MNKDDLESAMLKQYGQVIGGKDLHQALGFRTQSAFGRALRTNLLEIPVFDIPGRRGKFALTCDVASWLQGLRKSATSKLGDQKRE